VHPVGGFTSRLNGRQKNRNQNADNGDDDKKFNEGETGFCKISVFR
jgi:hypothetical protein